MNLRWQRLSLPETLTPPWLDREVWLPLTPNEQPRVWRDGEVTRFGFNPKEVIERIRRERYASTMRSITHRLPLAYDRLPPQLRALGAHLVFRAGVSGRRVKHPLPDAANAVDILEALQTSEPTKPSEHNRLVISCDVDSAQGLRAAPRLAKRFERQGLRATFFIVGELFERGKVIIDELAERGHAIGAHGWRHDNRLIQLGESELRRRLRRAKEMVRPYGSSLFRSPSLLRSELTSRLIGEHFAVDSSVCDVDLEHPRGVLTTRPFRLDTHVSIPITLPMDSSLRFTGHRPDEIGQIWRSKMTRVHQGGGVAVLAVHSERHLSGGRKMAACTESFLDWAIGQPGVRPASLEDVALSLSPTPREV